MSLAAAAGCRGVCSGFESPTAEGLGGLGKTFNLGRCRDLRASVRRVQRHKILFVGSSVIGLDVDRPGIGRRVADAAIRYGVNDLNVMFLTPLPGTRLWEQMEDEDRIILNEFPQDRRHYTMGFPVARYKYLSADASIAEVEGCNARFYSLPRTVARVGRDLVAGRQPIRSLVSNLAYRNNARLSVSAHAEFRGGQAGRRMEAVPGLKEPSLQCGGAHEARRAAVLSSCDRRSAPDRILGGDEALHRPPRLRR